MQVTETLVEGLKRHFKVVLPARELDEKVDSRLREIAQTVRLPGFRPGKVPYALVKKRYGGSVMGEVLERAVQDSSTQAISERGLRPAGSPKIEITNFSEGTDLEYTLALELLPDIGAIDFAALTLERMKADLGDADVEEELVKLAERSKRTQPVERVAQQGDTVIVDFVGRIGEQAFEGGSATDFPLELGSGSAIPGFEEQIVGIAKGESRAINVSFPGDYRAENLAGKHATFNITAKEVREATPAGVDEELAKSVGAEDLAALRKFMRERMEREAQQAARVLVKRQLLDQLAEAYKFPVPQSMVEAEFEAIWKQVEEARKNGQLEPEQAAKSEDALKEEYRAIADRRVRLGLILSEVARTNNIAVKEDELRRAAVDQARRFSGQERQVLEFFRKNPEAMGSLRAPILEEKVVDFILEMARVEDKPVGWKELVATAEQQTGEAEAAEGGQAA